ncbi:hypothetical protein B0H21DRAFT_134053 [Amylocystis lapponica]|nr:hypothetical protein B0H21DRAFT_134053 [Amylocystis lapponica]
MPPPALTHSARQSRGPHLTEDAPRGRFQSNVHGHIWQRVEVERCSLCPLPMVRAAHRHLAHRRDHQRANSQSGIADLRLALVARLPTGWESGVVRRYCERECQIRNSSRPALSICAEKVRTACPRQAAESSPEPATKGASLWGPHAQPFLGFQPGIRIEANRSTACAAGHPPASRTPCAASEAELATGYLPPQGWRRYVR